jgi:membrane associated rhomboid family serine protease
MDTAYATIALVIANVLFSYNAFKDKHLQNDNIFNIDRILVGKEYKRMITSGFLHANVWHLGFNMIALHSFGSALEFWVGSMNFLIIYFASLIGGSLLSLYMHRNHGEYSALGASGAVFGVVYATIVLHPSSEVSLFMVLPIVAWAYGLLFIVISIYGIRAQEGNIGHDAHLGGALIGMLTLLIMRPYLFQEHFITIAVLVLPAVFFIFMIVRNPAFITIDSVLGKGKGFTTVEDRYNADKAKKQQEIDRILDKIAKKGIDSLTAREREILKNQD